MPSDQFKTIDDVVLMSLSNVNAINDIPVEVIAALLVGLLSGNTNQVKVKLEKLDRLTKLEFNLDGGHKGRTIGKSGHTIRSLRSLCKSIARSRGQDILIELPGCELDSL